ncbi:unnamed protein product [Sphagnum balticum]
MPIARAKAHAVPGCYHVAMTTLARKFIWPSNSSMLSRYINSFSISPSMASKPMRRKLSLRFPCLGASARVYTTQLTKWHTFLAINVVHFGSYANVALGVTTAAALHSIS